VARVLAFFFSREGKEGERKERGEKGKMEIPFLAYFSEEERRKGERQYPIPSYLRGGKRGKNPPPYTSLVGRKRWGRKGGERSMPAPPDDTGKRGGEGEKRSFSDFPWGEAGKGGGEGSFLTLRKGRKGGGKKEKKRILYSFLGNDSLERRESIAVLSPTSSPRGGNVVQGKEGKERGRTDFSTHTLF